MGAVGSKLAPPLIHKKTAKLHILSGQRSTTLVHMSEIPPPWDPVMHDVTSLGLNQLFVGLAIFVIGLLGNEAFR